MHILSSQASILSSFIQIYPQMYVYMYKEAIRTQSGDKQIDKETVRKLEVQVSLYRSPDLKRPF